MNHVLESLRGKLVLPLLMVLTLGGLPLSGLADPGMEATPVVNINQAGPEELAEALHGVGIAKARAIIEDRDRNGPFDSPEALSRVSGIGETTIQNNRERIRTR